MWKILRNNEEARARSRGGGGGGGGGGQCPAASMFQKNFIVDLDELDEPAI